MELQSVRTETAKDGAGGTEGERVGQKSGLKRKHEEEEVSPTKKLVDSLTDYQPL